MIDPVVHGAALHQHISGMQLYRFGIQNHVHLARHDDHVVDGFGEMRFGGDAGLNFEDADQRAVFRGRTADLARAGVFVAVIGRGRRIGHPDQPRIVPRPP